MSPTEKRLTRAISLIRCSASPQSIPLQTTRRKILETVGGFERFEAADSSGFAATASLVTIRRHLLRLLRSNLWRGGDSLELNAPGNFWDTWVCFPCMGRPAGVPWPSAGLSSRLTVTASSIFSDEPACQRWYLRHGWSLRQNPALHEPSRPVCFRSGCRFALCVSCRSWNVSQIARLRLARGRAEPFVRGFSLTTSCGLLCREWGAIRPGPQQLANIPTKGANQPSALGGISAGSGRI